MGDSNLKGTKNVKLHPCLTFVGFALILVACQNATPFPTAVAAQGTQFTLAPGQSATVTGTDLTITFHSILGDDRCPSGVECAASGPVTISLAVGQGDGDATDLTLQTFTDNNGRAPGGQFEGIEDRVEVGDYLIQILGVTPYPKDLSTRIKPSEYRLILIVTGK